MRVVVLMASYQGELFIKEQIDSILSQRGVNVELLIRDDNSRDATGEICLSYSRKDARVKFRRAQGTKPGAAENFYSLIRELELDNTPNTYVALADQDDIWLEDKLVRAINFLEQSCAAGYSSNVIAFYPNGERKLVRKDFPQKEYDFLFEGPGPGSSFLMKTDLVRELQSFVREHRELSDSLKYHDWVIYAFARSRGFKWVIDPQPSLLYRQHEGNVIGANGGIGAAIKRAKYVLAGNGLQEALDLRRVLYPDTPNYPYPRDLDTIARLKIAAAPFRYRRSLSGVILLSCALLSSLAFLRLFKKHKSRW